MTENKNDSVSTTVLFTDMKEESDPIDAVTKYFINNNYVDEDSFYIDEDYYQYKDLYQYSEI